MEEYKLQPLRINSGWTVEHNNFFQCEPDSCVSFVSYFIEDLLQLTNNKYNLIIDLGWYGDEKGSFQLLLIKNYNWEKPLEYFKDRNTKVIVEKIEYWTNYCFFQKYI
ncbi:hypothetical protein [Sporomusa aerivorans]|uniref:hypothetical protein n=1 Tax=Sporomusa aerivorans TaxID=204936 RepID=UPI00352B86AB